MTLLRSLAYMVWFWVVSAAMTIAWLPSLLGPRRRIVTGVEIWVRLLLWGARGICGLRHEVRGREHLPEGPAIFAGKHLSMWETMAVFLVLKDPAIILKRELLWVPLYGWYALKLRMISIDRAAAASALRAMVAQAKARIAEGRPIVIFPEGTRVAPGTRGDYKPGVAALYRQLDVPCVPFAHNSGVYWARKGPIRRPGTIVLEFLPPIPPGLSREAFMRTLETQIETAALRLAADAGADTATRAGTAPRLGRA